MTLNLFQVKVGQNTTLVDLINHLVSSGQPLSNDNPSTLKFPVDRKQHQIDRCQITLGSKIENVRVFSVLYYYRLKEKMSSRFNSRLICYFNMKSKKG